MDDESKKENTQSTFFLKRRSSSILKLSETEKVPNIDDQEDTKIRKSRRVSFSARIQVKTIDDSHLHDPNLRNDSITIANTNANSNSAKNHLLDISNRTKKVNEPTNVAQEEKIRINYVDDSIMKRDNKETVSIVIDGLDQTLTAICKANLTLLDVQQSTSIFEYSMDKSVLNEMQLTNPAETQLIEPSTNEDKSLLADETTKNILTLNNKTFDVSVSVNLTTDKTPLANDRHPHNESNQVNHTYIVAAKTQETFTIDNSSNLKREFECLNDSASRQPTLSIENLNETTTKLDQGKCELNRIEDLLKKNLDDDTSLSSPSAKLSLDGTKYDVSNEMISTNDNRQSIGDSFLSLKMPIFEPKKDFQTEYEKLKKLLTEKRDKLKKLNSEMKPKENQLDEDIQKIDKNIKNLIKKNNKLKKKADQAVMEKYKMYREAALNDTYYELDYINKHGPEKVDYLEKEVNEYDEKNKQFDKEIEKLSEDYSELVEKIKSNSEKIKIFQEGQETRLNYKEICEKIFNNEIIKFKLLYFDKGTILVSFFFDFIELEIKAAYLLNDLISRSIQSNDFYDLNQWHKCLNYPIQKLFSRSTIDLVGNGTCDDDAFYATNRDRECLMKKTSNKVPIYIRYCVDLILKEVGEGDILATNKKYKYIKDISLLIKHFELACKCATNLAIDFEYFANRTLNTKIKCEFDFKKHLVSLVLPSLDDACYYKLNLSILPGRYYQEPIPFTIESIDPDDIFQPNINKLRNIIEGQYFEDGSLKNFLLKLKLI